MGTRRKYADELFPEAEVDACGGSGKLSAELPYLYARAIGLEVHGTDWLDLHRNSDKAVQMLTVNRVEALDQARRIALLADAIFQGMTGQEAWDWADCRADEDGNEVRQRARHFGVDVAGIRPYPVLSEPDHHTHLDPAGRQVLARVKESQCPQCCEPEEFETSRGAGESLADGTES